MFHTRRSLCLNIIRPVEREKGCNEGFSSHGLSCEYLPPFARILRRYRRLWNSLPHLIQEATAHGLSKRDPSMRYSLVVACYNVEKYIDDFFQSIFSQRIDSELPGNHSCRRWLDRRHRFAYRLLATTLSRVRYVISVSLTRDKPQRATQG